MSVLLTQLPTVEDQNVVMVAMLTPSHAVDSFLDDFVSKSRSRKASPGGDHRRLLYKFVDSLDANIDVTEITSDHVRSFFRGYTTVSINTRSTYDAYLRSFFGWLPRSHHVRVPNRDSGVARRRSREPETPIRGGGHSIAIVCRSIVNRHISCTDRATICANNLPR